MAIPSGSGTEVLRRMGIYNQGTSETQIDWAQAVQTTAANNSGTVAVPANVIITVLSILITNRNTSNARLLDIIIDTTSNQLQILKQQTVGGAETFVFSDKLVLREGDQLIFDSSDDAVDIRVEFIYQDWT